jgi:hypothetical protein
MAIKAEKKSAEKSSMVLHLARVHAVRMHGG